ncbi:MAG TPA: hypothetical protein VIJ02_07780 [Thermoanaerobaculia bacterium]
MRKRLLTLTAALALTALASWVPRAEAVGYCSASYCAGKSPEASCGCPPGTDKPGKPSICGGWNTVSAIGCWYE